VLCVLLEASAAVVAGADADGAKRGAKEYSLQALYSRFPILLT